MLDLRARPGDQKDPKPERQEQFVTRVETGTFVVLVAFIIIWAVLGPGGWVSGIIGALVGLAVAGALVSLRRRDSTQP